MLEKQTPGVLEVHILLEEREEANTLMQPKESQSYWKVCNTGICVL